jgi:hypothetical protein
MVSSRMLESFCADIESLLRDRALRPALRFSLALPDICTALEDAQMQSSGESYAAWCATWLVGTELGGRKPIDGARLCRLHTGRARLRRSPREEENQTAAALSRLRMSRRSRSARSVGRSRVRDAANRLQAFQENLAAALVDAARRWYRERGASSALVQQNLGRLLVSG